MKLLALETQFNMAESISELNHTFTHYFNQLGISMFSFTYYASVPGSTNKIKHDFFSKSYKIWHKHYLESGYEDIDSSFNIVRFNTLPTYWNIEQQIAQAKSAREKQMRLDSQAYGVREGLLIPIFGIEHEFATLVTAQTDTDKSPWDWTSIKFDLMIAGHLYYNYLQPFLSTQPNSKPLLTRRELQCLSLVARKKTLESIAQQLDITIRTVNFHLHNVNKKLGVKNKHQAVTEAMKINLID